MRNLMLICLLAVSAAAVAETSAPVPATSADSAKREAEDAKTRAKLDEARARIDKAAREVSELSMKLGAHERNEFFFSTTNDGGPRRAMLGVQIDDVKDGARVISVSPGGPAEQAGLRTGDVITSLDGKTVLSSETPGRVVTERMRDIKPDQKVKVVVLREGKSRDLVVVARPIAVENQFFRAGPGVVGPMSAMPGMPGMPMTQQFHGFFQGEFGGMELASLTQKLGAYFGTSDGVLVVQAPDNAAFKLEDGDVIQSIDGRKPDDGAHAMRILRSYRGGEKLSVNVLRQRKPVTLAITMPDRPEAGDHFMFEAPMPPPPPVPASPPTPALPGAPGGGGTID